MPLSVFVGEIARKPGFVGDRIEAREFLSMTILFDHDVVDGGPMALFLQRLRDLMERAAYL
jgi:pyruvate/2-oxoglutarate dehydrogenase complex dihydrolipoamide acyltransferase (E2) component